MLGSSRSSAEVTVELPFTIVFEPPSWSELRALLRMRGHWVAGLIIALTIGTAYVLANVARADSETINALMPLVVTSQPPGASAIVDGHDHGVTPVDLRVEPGSHRVLLKDREALEIRYMVEVGSGGTELNAVLWRHQPKLTRLRPALPGATLTAVRLLDDGDL